MIKSVPDTELQEIKRITDNISVIIDSERKNENESLSKERQSFVDTCREIDIPCYVLELRAIENYFTDRAIKKIKGKKYRSLNPYEKLNDCELPWAKHENWEMARELTTEELQTTDLGTFLNTLG
ncbi:hypothetical protein ACFLXY_09845 [Chloroflexota bacterium]